MNQCAVIYHSLTTLILFQLYLSKGQCANVCYQCASTSTDSECMYTPQLAIHKNCTMGQQGFKTSYCVTQTIEQKGELVAIIRECTTDAGLGVKWCQLDETPMTGFAIKCTFICSSNLCNGNPLHLSRPAHSATSDTSHLTATNCLGGTKIILLSVCTYIALRQLN